MSAVSDREEVWDPAAGYTSHTLHHSPRKHLGSSISAPHPFFSLKLSSQLVLPLGWLLAMNCLWPYIFATDVLDPWPGELVSQPQPLTRFEVSLSWTHPWVAPNTNLGRFQMLDFCPWDLALQDDFFHWIPQIWVPGPSGMTQITPKPPS